jgi:hypothetical protein
METHFQHMETAAFPLDSPKTEAYIAVQHEMLRCGIAPCGDYAQGS